MENRATGRVHLAKWRLTALVAVWLLCFLAAGTPNRGRCVTAAVPWPFALPDGTVVPAGPLTLCLDRVHDPVTGLHELRAAGRPVGLYTSRLGEAEDQRETRAVVVFEITARGSHRLLGYTIPEAESVRTFRFYDPRAGKAELLAARAPLLERERTDATVFVAAVAAVPRPR